MKITFTAVLLISLSGCTYYQIGTATHEYKDASKLVNLGDTKEQVLTILEPTQETLAQHQRKQPDMFMNGNNLVEIYYFRSGWQSDGLTTDDEFTPYTFIDGKLIAIGWAALGGAKSYGQATSTTSTSVNSSKDNSDWERTQRQIQNHGAGGCTPNFSTGGCL